jgi:Rrf2 family iron-sulfur cluster assembly transcriptional regulator|tara:strand:+ start:74 stop:496 length:423 start_codon:yes stop_codon:yes gene_type:complete
MKLTTKGRYAVMAMADLASNDGSSPISLNEIARRQNISLSYLEQLFVKLRNNHLVKSVRGSQGGYMLEKKAKDIKISSIISAVDEEIRTLNCKKDSKKGCGGRSVKCVTHYLWDDLEQHIRSFFENKNLNELVTKQENIF